MRILIAAGVTLFLASSGSAMAAECTKGLLWPYVRNPGDCLTDDEGAFDDHYGRSNVHWMNAEVLKRQEHDQLEEFWTGA